MPCDILTPPPSGVWCRLGAAGTLHLGYTQVATLLETHSDADNICGLFHVQSVLGPVWLAAHHGKLSASLLPPLCAGVLCVRRAWVRMRTAWEAGVWTDGEG